MTLKDFNNRKKAIKAHVDAGYLEEAIESCIELVEELFKEKEYSKIVEVYQSNLISKEHLFVFEVAYSLVDKGYKNDAEEVYESLLKDDPQNSSILNNLSNLKKEKGQIEKAFDLIQRANAIAPKDEIVSRNYNNLLSIVQEKEETEKKDQAAVKSLERENDFVIEKLKSFVANTKADPEFKKGRLPIPRWKFRVLMQTDGQKAISLLDQWIDKGYLRKTSDRGNYGELVYEINPYIEKGLKGLKKSKMPSKWIKGIENLNLERLEELNYFHILSCIDKVKKKFKKIILRDVEELFLNYLMKNEKAITVLSGSLVEVLLIYYCEKKKISTITYQKHNKAISRKLYEADLGDILSFFEQQKMLGDIIIHMGNISRISRNFIHPGKELRETEELNQSKAELCFISTLEIIRKVCA
jgi:Tfp pilus assembly protein PilF